MAVICTAWITESDLEDCGPAVDELSSERLAQLMMAASEWLYKNSGEQFPGTCQVTERPCSCGCGCGYMSTEYYGGGYFLDGYPRLMRSCCDSYFCGCAGESTVRLTYGPVTGTPSVMIDGQAFTNFSVVAPNILVRTDTSWPSCQSYTDGWTVTYEYGVEPPELGKMAAVALTHEFIKACSSASGECKLPGNVISLVRRNVSYQLDPKLAGQYIYEVSAFMGAYGRKGQADIRIPGRRRGHVTAGPLGS